MTFRHDIRVVATTVFGLVNALAGGFFLWLEEQQKSPHSSHVYIFAAWIGLGMAIMWPSVVLGTAKQIVVLLPFDFKVGGNRRTDPPAQPSSPKRPDDTP